MWRAVAWIIFSPACSSGLCQQDYLWLHQSALHLQDAGNRVGGRVEWLRFVLLQFPSCLPPLRADCLGLRFTWLHSVFDNFPSLLNFALKLRCATGLCPRDLEEYGCSCRYVAAGNPVDPLDMWVRLRSQQKAAAAAVEFKMRHGGLIELSGGRQACAKWAGRGFCWRVRFQNIRESLVLMHKHWAGADFTCCPSTSAVQTPWVHETKCSR